MDPIVFMICYYIVYNNMYLFCRRNMQVTEETKVFSEGELGKAPEGYVINIMLLIGMISVVIFLSRITVTQSLRLLLLLQEWSVNLQRAVFISK